MKISHFFKLFIFVGLFYAASLQAQSVSPYQTGIGLRGGLGGGVTFKHFLNEKGAFEGLLTTRWAGVMVTGLYEVHFPIEGVKNLQWYVGGGAHIGHFLPRTAWGRGWNRRWADNEEAVTIVGLDGIVGIDYTFEEFPLTLALDYKPAFNFIGYYGFWPDMFALSIRYNIK